MIKLDVGYVARNIRQQRERLYYSQEYMGVKLGMGQNAYSKIELGKCKITVERLLNIAQILGTDVMVLLQNNENTIEPKLALVKDAI